MNEEIKIAILEVLARPGKKWNWYSLDRALSMRGLGGQLNVAEAANYLASEGLLKETIGNNPAMPTYSITAKGREMLARCG